VGVDPTAICKDGKKEQVVKISKKRFTKTQKK
jgi:hypothetical protein